MTAARLFDQRAGWLILAGAGVAVLTACGGATNSSSSGSGAGSGGAATISAAQTSSGMVLTGPSGNTVYVLLDASGKPLPCTAGCPAVWPVVPTTGTPQAGSGVTAMLGTASAADGSTQASANGAPLYYYSGDTGSGQVNGQGLKSFGGTWYAVQANGQPVSGSGSGATASPRYGY